MKSVTVNGRSATFKRDFRVMPRYEQPGISDGTTFTCFIRRQSAFDFAWHFHREYELTLITAGTGTRYVGTTVERYRPGDLVLLGPDLPHTFASEPGEEMAEATVTQFRHDFLGPEFFALPQFRTLGGLLARSARGLRFGHDPGEVQALLARLPHLEAPAQTVALLDVLRRLAADAAATPITVAGYTPAPADRHLPAGHGGRRPQRLSEPLQLQPPLPRAEGTAADRVPGRTSPGRRGGL